MFYSRYNFVKLYTTYTVKSKSTWKMCHLLKKYSHVTAAGSAKCHFVRYPASRNTAPKYRSFMDFIISLIFYRIEICFTFFVKFRIGVSALRSTCILVDARF